MVRFSKPALRIASMYSEVTPLIFMLTKLSGVNEFSSAFCLACCWASSCAFCCARCASMSAACACAISTCTSAATLTFASSAASSALRFANWSNPPANFASTSACNLAISAALNATSCASVADNFSCPGFTCKASSAAFSAINFAAFSCKSAWSFSADSLSKASNSAFCLSNISSEAFAFFLSCEVACNEANGTTIAVIIRVRTAIFAGVKMPRCTCGFKIERTRFSNCEHAIPTVTVAV